MKLEIIEKMKNSESIKELNSHLIEYLNDLDAMESCSVYHYNVETNSKLLFKIKKYNFYNWSSDVLTKLGISTDLSDYPKIQEMVNELKLLNKESSAIHKKFNTHRKAELKRIKNESPEYQLMIKEHIDVLEQIRLLEEKRRVIQTQYTSWRDTAVNKIEKDAGFINPNIRISELNEKLK